MVLKQCCSSLAVLRSDEDEDDGKNYIDELHHVSDHPFIRALKYARNAQRFVHPLTPSPPSRRTGSGEVNCEVVHACSADVRAASAPRLLEGGQGL